MATAAYLPIVADRAGACVRTIRVIGLDLTYATLEMQVRQKPDTPGIPLLDLQLAEPDVEGLSLVSVATEDGVLVSTIQIRIDADTMRNDEKVPYMGELGEPGVLAYDLIYAQNGDVRRLAGGEFVALATVFGANSAPTSRPDGAGRSGRAWSTWSTATIKTLTDVAEISIDGVELLGPLLARAEAVEASLRAALDAVGWRLADTIGDREAIPLSERRYGLHVYVAAAGRVWIWSPAGTVGADGVTLTTDGWASLHVDAELLNRGNHTGTQNIDTINGLPETLIAIDTALSVKISGLRVNALSSVSPLAVVAATDIAGPVDKVVWAWSGYAVVTAGDTREFRPPVWSAVTSLFVAGNSLSDITDTTVRWSQLYAQQKGYALYSVARYSSDGRQPLRAGRVSIDLTIAGGVLPAGGTPAAVSQINGAAPDGGNLSFLNTGDAGITTGCSMAGTFIAGAIARHGTVSIPNAASLAYSVVQDAGQPALALTGPIRFVPDVASKMAVSANAFWPGNNEFYSQVPNANSDYTNPDMWVHIAQLVGGTAGQPTIILPVIPSSSWTDKSVGKEYQSMLAANARTEALYPSMIARSTDGRTLLQFLQDGGNATADERAAGFVPASLHRAGDTLHLNDAGDALVAQFVDQAFQRLAAPPAITFDTLLVCAAFGTNPRTGVPTIDVKTASVRRGTEASLDARVIANEQAIARLLYSPPKITALAAIPAQAEIGSTIASVTVNWAVSNAITGQTLNGVSVSSANRSATFANISATTPFNLAVTDASAPGGAQGDALSTAITFYQKGHAGIVDKAAGLASADANALSLSWWASSVARVLTVTVSAPGYLWYSQPAAQADPSQFKANGFAVTAVKSLRNHTTATNQVVQYADFRIGNRNAAGAVINLEIIA